MKRSVDERMAQLIAMARWVAGFAISPRCQNARGLNFTLVTDRGDFDLLAGNDESMQPFVETTRVLGLECPVLGLEKLIEVKRAAGRPRDLEAVAELEAFLEERENQ